MEKKMLNYGPFTGLDPAITPEATDTDYSGEVDIVKYKVIDVVKKTGEGETDYVLTKKVVPYSIENRKESIESYRNDVGILNILKKVALTGDATLLNQRGVVNGIDSTELPTNYMEACEMLEKGMISFGDLPDDIKQKMSFEEFAKNYKQEDFDAYVQAKVDAALAANKQNEGGAE